MPFIRKRFDYLQYALINFSKSLLLISVIMLPFYNCSLNERKRILINQHGTYIISAICEDGILVMSDTRVCFMDTDNKIGAYFEQKSKIYQFKDIAIAMAGTSTFSNIYFSELIDNFNRISTKDIEVDKFLDLFFAYAKNRLDPGDFEVFSKNQYLIAGYKGHKPYLVWNYINERKVFDQIGDFKTNNTHDTNNISLHNELKKATVLRAINLFGNSLMSFIEKANKDTISVYGGKPSFLACYPNGIKWFEKENKNNFLNHHEFLQAYKGNLIRISYRHSRDSISLRQALLEK